MERGRLRDQRDRAMGIFGEPPKHIDKLKQRVRDRDAKGEVAIERAYIDYDDRCTKAERAAIGQLDAHAMAQEAALQELTNRGEGVADSATNASPLGVDAKPEAEAHKPAAMFPAAAE